MGPVLRASLRLIVPEQNSQERLYPGNMAVPIQFEGLAKNVSPMLHSGGVRQGP